MKTNLYYLYFVLLGLVSCRDIIEEDIGDKKITVLTPSNNVQSPIYTQTFMWDHVDGALNYRLQVVSPSFDAIVHFKTDTTVKTNKLILSLDPGVYQWKIWAQNGNYSTEPQLYTLTIIEGPLAQQTVVLNTPVSNTYQKSPLFNYTWQSVFGADEYVIVIDTISQNFADPVIRDTVTASPYSFSMPKEGEYKWRVKAINGDGEETPWSTPFTFGYYNSKPPTPIPAGPANNNTQNSPVMFTWSAVDRADKYTLYIYRNNDSTSTNPDKYTITNGTSRSVSFSPANQEVYWRVSCTDKAGNESLLSAPARKLTTQ